MTEVKKEEPKADEASKAENPDENIEIDAAILKESELDNLDDDNEAEYHRRSFHAREYKSETIEQTQKEVEEHIVKAGR